MEDLRRITATTATTMAIISERGVADEFIAGGIVALDVLPEW